MRSFTEKLAMPYLWLLAIFCQLIVLQSQAHANKTVTHDKIRIEGSGKRDRSHINEMLWAPSMSLYQKPGQESVRQKILSDLTNIYKNAIRPLESLYRFDSLNLDLITVAEIHSKPLVVFLGPWSTGKSTIINYLLNIDDPAQALYTGAEPTTSDFTIVTYGESYKTVEGVVLVTDPKKQFSDLEKYGQAFLEKFEGYEMNCPLLERLTIVDTPGIIENRKQQERGYPFNDVVKWFIDRADLIFVVFDPSKLDVGGELESTFKQLKGKEAQIRLILNKADTISTQELMRVYGALFWNFAPLINLVEPPRVYVGSFWSKAYREGTNQQLFFDEERALLLDLYEIIANSVENKVALVRQHGHRVLMHCVIVDRFLEAFSRERTLFANNELKWSHIIDSPERYGVYRSALTEASLSRYDLPPVDRYREFFHTNSLSAFSRLSSHCGYLTGCPLDRLRAALATDLPALLARCQRELKANRCVGNDGTCSVKDNVKNEIPTL